MWHWMRKKFGVAGGKRGRRKSSASPKWDPQATLRGLQRLGVAALLLSVAAAAVWSEDQLVRYARHRPLPLVSVDNITLVDAPEWMSPLTRQEVRSRVAHALIGDPLSPQGLQDAAAALADCPWVAKVWRIERDGGSGARIVADYRRPAALIEHHGEFYLAAADGVRLPGVYMPHQVPAVGLPTAVDVRDRLPREGELWGEDVAAALRLVSVLEPQPYFEQIRAISLRDEAGRLRPALLTSRPGAAVFWGRPVGEEQPIEVPTHVKLQNLDTIYRQRGSIDAGGKRVHIYGPAIFVERDGLDPEHPDFQNSAEGSGGETTRGVNYTW